MGLYTLVSPAKTNMHVDMPLQILQPLILLSHLRQNVWLNSTITVQCRPESLRPRSPTCVLYCCGMLRMTSWISAILATSWTSWILALTSPYWRLYRTVSWNSTESCSRMLCWNSVNVHNTTGFNQSSYINYGKLLDFWQPNHKSVFMMAMYCCDWWNTPALWLSKLNSFL